jgi:hypothetical protein
LVEPRHAVFGLHRGADGDELRSVFAPLVVVDVEAHAHDTVGAQLGRLFFHSSHREFASVVHRLSQLGQFLALAPLSSLDTGVVDRRTHNEAHGVKSDLLNEEEFIHRQVRSEEALFQFLQPVLGGLG